MYRTLFAIVAVFAVALALVGFTFSSVKLEARADFVFVNGSEPQSLDPHRMKGQPEGRIADCLLEGLTRRDGRSFEPAPGVAKTWEVSSDGRTWTFHLRDDAKWSNGDRVTAHDFAWAWRRLEDPGTASEYSAVLHVVRHAKAFNLYAAQVSRLRGDPNAEKPDEREGVLRRWNALAAANPAGIAYRAWVEFVVDDRNALRDTVAGTQDPALVGALSRNAGDVTPDEAKAIGAALEAEADRRAKELQDAQAHFGVDQGAYAKDDSTFVVELSSLAPYFLELTLFYVTYPVHRPTVERWGMQWSTVEHFVGNGPFRLEAWRLNEKMRLVRSPTYWGAAEVRLRTVELLPIENANTALNLYLMQEVDWIPGSYPPDLIEQIRRRRDYRDCPGMIIYFYRMNVTREPFKDPRMRKAFAKCVDRERIVRTITLKGEIPTTTIVPPGVPNYKSPENDLSYDPAAARALMAEAGYGPGKKGLKKFTIVHNTQETHKKIAEFVAQEWHKHLGADVEVINKEWQALLADVHRLEFDIERAGWIGDYRDPKTFLDMWQTGDGNNETGWSDATFDKLIASASGAGKFAEAGEQDVGDLLALCSEKDRVREIIASIRSAKDATARLEATLALRSHLFREAEGRLLREGVPIIPFYFYVVSGLLKPDVEGIYYTSPGEGKPSYNLQDDHPLRNVSTARSREASR